MPRQSPILSAVLAFAAGVLTARGFAPQDWWPLAVIGSAMLVALVDVTHTWRGAALVGWAWGFGMFVTSLGWIATAFTFQSNMPAAMGWVAVVGLSAFLALYPALAGWLARMVRAGGVPRLLVLTGAFMVTEWVRGHFLSGFAWNPLGAAWLEAPGVAQLARYVGPQGLTGVMLLAGGALWLIVRPRATVTGRVGGAGLALLVVLLGAVGSGQVRDVYFPDNPTLVIVQPNIGQDEKYEEGANDRHLEAYLALTRQGLAAVDASPAATGPASAAEPANGQAFGAVEPQAAADSTFSDTLAGATDGLRPNIVLWSESSVFGLVEEEPALRAHLASVLGPNDLLVFGGVAATRDPRGELLGVTNSLFVLDSRGRLLGRYDKAHLTPLGEYLPMRPLMERLGLSRLAPGSLDFTPGPGPRTLTVPGMPPLGAMICYEIIFGSAVTEKGNRPAWIANISNDAWFGPSGPPQHLAQARLRAIEEGLPIARATPTGESAVIDPFGTIRALQPLGTAGVLRFTLPPPLPPTPYALAGDWLPLAMALFLALAGAVIGGRLAPKPRR
ncbi:apolipoprotein N-acyltransferase [Polymorphobacter sp.]|uniref:apolipoprotein N-acyltransferase n=1 Tax=Polymorphobacter sp. TaxID=1909290 RepID=UPI003F6F1668